MAAAQQPQQIHKQPITNKTTQLSSPPLPNVRNFLDSTHYQYTAPQKSGKYRVKILVFDGGEWVEECQLGFEVRSIFDFDRFVFLGKSTDAAVLKNNFELKVTKWSKPVRSISVNSESSANFDLRIVNEDSRHYLNIKTKENYLTCGYVRERFEIVYYDSTKKEIGRDYIDVALVRNNVLDIDPLISFHGNNANLKFIIRSNSIKFGDIKIISIDSNPHIKCEFSAHPINKDSGEIRLLGVSADSVITASTVSIKLKIGDDTYRCNVVVCFNNG